MKEEDTVRNCRSCPARYVPSPARDFYPDDPANPAVGLCEDCVLHEALARRKAPDASALVPLDHVQECCKPGTAKACAFLTFSEAGWTCAKGGGFESLIRQRLSDGTMNARGGNCSGPPDFTPTAE